MELLAPAGNVETFQIAVKAGADAIYVGAPRLNARNLSRDLNLEEIGGLVRFAHEQGKKVYIALNSLVRETDLRDLLETLGYLEAIAPDGLIVQDLGVMRLVSTYFPHLKLHGSTLATVHNQAGIEFLATLGVDRVVLARELSVKEIAALTATSRVEIEVFVHGAMCFSYSGLCLFSSFLGGKSGLRGNCVQPCRRKFSFAERRGSSGKSGYYFSMNDLSALPLVPELQRSGVDSLKIEGRLRQATYVKHIVTAYRMVIDARAEDKAQAIAEATALIPAALGRKTSPGYFLTPRPKGAIVTHHSGNIGDHMGRIERIERSAEGLYAVIRPKRSCRVGERVRLHCEKSGERIGFTIKQLLVPEKNVSLDGAKPLVKLLLPALVKEADLSGRVELYRVDPGDTGAASSHGREPLAKAPLNSKKMQAVIKRVGTVGAQLRLSGETGASGPRSGTKRGATGKGGSSELWLRLDSARPLCGTIPFQVDRYVLSINKNNMSEIGQLKRCLGRSIRLVVWALPPIVLEPAVKRLQKDIALLINSGFRAFQIGHLSQVSLCAGRNVKIFGDFSLNILNSQALVKVSEIGLVGAQLAIESDRECLERAVAGYRRHDEAHGRRKGNASERSLLLGLTVYGAPPLFTSRLAADQFVYGAPLFSPKREGVVLEKREWGVLARPQKPFSLLPYRRELEHLGLRYLVVDLCGLKSGARELQELGRRIEARDKLYKLPTFNYLGHLQ